VSEAGSGRLGRFDPSDGKWKSWRLPGDHPQPGALYVDAMDRIWLSDLGDDAVLRFDPQSEKFTAYPSDQAEARVSQLNGRPGEVWGADAGSDRLLVIRE